MQFSIVINTSNDHDIVKLVNVVEQALNNHLPKDDVEVYTVGEDIKIGTSEDFINPSEAVYGFAAWLTMRKEKIVASSKSEAKPMANAVQEFIAANNWQPVREGWSDNITSPEALRIAKEEKAKLGARLFVDKSGEGHDDGALPMPTPSDALLNAGTDLKGDEPIV